MKKKIKLGSLFLILSMMLAVLFSYNNVTRANETNVSNMQELKDAITNNESISITTSFEITEEIVIPSSYSGTIRGNGNTLSLGAVVENMFVSNGATVTFEDITLDGMEKGRLLKALGGNVTFIRATLTKGTTNHYEPKIVGNDDNQNYQGGALFIESGATVLLQGTTFDSNYTKLQVPEPVGQYAPPSGGAVYIGGRSTVNVNDGSFINNRTGRVVDGVGNNGEGGAIKVEGGSTLNINSDVGTLKNLTVFTGNRNNATGGGGNQGGAIEVTDSTANIYATTFNVAGPFDTGGAIKFQGATGIVKNCEFKLDDLGDRFGISGGAIMSQDSELVIEKTDFSATGNSKVAFAGGFIAVTGGGRFHLLDSTLTGKGQGNGRELASFGGALAFETGSSAKAWINNTIFENLSSSDTGGAISVGTRKGEERYDEGDGTFGPYSNQSVTITNSTIRNTQTLWWGRQPGGAIYVGPRNSVLVYNSTINNAKAGVGGGIYNMGVVTLDGGSRIDNGYAMFAGASVFNDGKFIINNASLNASFTGDAHWNGNYTKYKNPVEFPGINIYAKKDIIVSPKANFNDKDIKVFDGVSSVVLTGNLTKQLNVSISELEGENTSDSELYETNHRYVGYTVDRGLKSSDLENIPDSYKSNDLDVKFIPSDLSEYEPVPSDAQFIHYVTKRTADTDDKVSAHDDYTSLAKWDYVFNPEDKTVVLGQRAKLVYHTNEANGTIDGGVADDAPAGQKLEQVYTFYMSKEGQNPKVSINNEVATELTVTDKIPQLQDYTFKSWNTDSVIDKAKYDVHKVEDKYDFIEEGTFSKKWLSPRNSEITRILSPEEENTLHTYAVYDKMFVFKAKKVWNAENKEEVTFQLIRLDKPEAERVVEEKPVGVDNSDWVVFNAVPKMENGVDVSSKYVVVEKGMTGDRKLILNDKKYDVSILDVTTDTNEVPAPESDTKYFTITNTELVDINVTKQWFNGNENVTADHKENVEVELYVGDEKIGDNLTLTSEGSYVAKFENLPKLNDDGIVIDYKVKENRVNEDGVVRIENKDYNVVVDGDKDTGFTIKNTLKEPEKVNIEGSKTWVDNDDQDGKRPKSITIQLKKGNKVVDTKNVTPNETGEWKWSFTDKPKYEDDGTILIKYTIDEVEVDGYTKVVDGYNVTNTHIPETVTVAGSKTWEDNNNQDRKRPEKIIINLMKNGVKEQSKEVREVNGNWTWNFENLPKYENGNVINYTITEDKVEGYSTEVQGYNVINRYTPETVTVAGSKTWEDNNNQDRKRPEKIIINLMKNGVKEQSKEVREADGNWTWSFENLPKYENGNVINYTITEEVVEGYSTEVQGYNVTNRYTPETITVSGSKTWEDNENKDNTRPETITVKLLKNGEVFETKTIAETDGWSWTFKNLPKYENGQEIIYSITEEAVENYTININGYNVTNTYIPPVKAKKEIVVTKKWEGTVKEDSVQVQLYANEETLGEVVTLNESTEWEYRFIVDIDENINYSVKEVGVENDVLKVGDNKYNVAITGNEEDGYVITNTYVEPISITPLTPATTKVKVTKTWSDETHKAEVTVKLIKNGEETEKTVVLNEENNWTATFENLPVVDKVTDENANVYTVKEVGEENGVIKLGEDKFTVEVAGNQSDGYVINNKYIPNIDIPTQKPKPEPKPQPTPNPQPKPQPELPNKIVEIKKEIPKTAVSGSSIVTMVMALVGTITLKNYRKED